MGEPFPTVAVLGAGSMGHGIAEVIALSGRTVHVRDVDQEILDDAEDEVEWSLDKLVENDVIDAETRDETRDRLTFTLDIDEAVGDADLVIEAVPEDLDLKRKVWKEAEEAAPDDATFATNTSSLSVTDQAEATGRPERFAGLHFFNPPIKMDLVEVVYGDRTSDETIDQLVDFTEDLGKTPVVVDKDLPGFIVNRVIGIYMFEAAWLLEEDAVERETLDSCMKYQVGFPMGPFELLDYTGLDIAAHVAESQGQDVPPPLTRLVQDGRLGEKTGEGFYDWSDGRPQIKPDAGEGVDPWPLLAPTINAAVDLIELGVADAATVDQAMRLGTGFPDGPLKMADDVGLQRIVDELEDHPRYEAVDLLVEMAEDGETFYDVAEAEEAGVDYDTLQVDVDGHVATVTLDRPDRLNTVNQELMDDLTDALDRLARDDDVRVLVLRGAGDKAFCAGADVTSFVDAEPHFMLQRSDAFERLAEFPKPTVAAIHGYCFGGGLELALACDFRLAREDAEIGQTEINLGLIPGGGGTQRLVSLLGLAKAKEVVMLGEKFDAQRAHDLGLLTDVAAEDDFEDAVDELAGRLADGPPIALKAAKQLLDRAGGPDQAMLEAERMAFGLLMATDDVAEGVSAFLSKRDPEFTGE